MLNQQTTMGMAPYVPMHARNKAAYCRSRLLWTLMRMPYPTNEMSIESSVNRYRCLNMSEKIAMSSE